jgi:hypothetical protein
LRCASFSPGTVVLAVAIVALLVWVARASAAWTSPADVSPEGQNADSHQLAIDPNGDAVVVWRRSDGTNNRVEARARSAAGALSPTSTLSGSGYNSGALQVAMDARGNAIVVWSRANLRVQARLRTAAGALSPIENLSAVGVNAVYPNVAGNPAGQVVSAWARSGTPYTRIQAAAGP